MNLRERIKKIQTVHEYLMPELHQGFKVRFELRVRVMDAGEFRYTRADMSKGQQRLTLQLLDKDGNEWGEPIRRMTAQEQVGNFGVTWVTLDRYRWQLDATYGVMVRFERGIAA